MTGTANQLDSHYDCSIKHNGDPIFVARFQRAEDAVDFQKRNKIVSIEQIVKDYYEGEGEPDAYLS